jgi:hypothetical protein
VPTTGQVVRGAIRRHEDDIAAEYANLAIIEKIAEVPRRSNAATSRSSAEPRILAIGTTSKAASGQHTNGKVWLTE